MVIKAILDLNEVSVYGMVIWGTTYDKSMKQKKDYKVL